MRHVENFTDIDDKMIKGAEEEGISTAELAERNIENYLPGDGRPERAEGARLSSRHPRRYPASARSSRRCREKECAYSL